MSDPDPDHDCRQNEKSDPNHCQGIGIKKESLIRIRIRIAKQNEMTDPNSYLDRRKKKKF
jgi:hypothetical protein